MFKLIGTKWGDPTFGTPSGTINWQANLNGLDTPSSADVDDLVNSLGQAFDRWEDAASVEFANGGGGIEITFASFSPDGIFREDDPAAMASWTSLVPGTLQPVDPVITFNSDLTWAPNGAGGVDFFAVALHEIGHIIGLDHPTEFDENPGEIMNPVVRTDDLGPGDLNGIQQIYGTDPGDDVAPTVGSGGGGVGPGGDDGGGGGGAAAGLLAGLIALIVGLFTGGAGAVVAMAAARVADENDDDVGDTETFAGHGSGCGCAACCGLEEVVLADGSVQVSHVTFVDLPLVDFDYDSFEAGDQTDEDTEEFMLV